MPENQEPEQRLSPEQQEQWRSRENRRLQELRQGQARQAQGGQGRVLSQSEAQEQRERGLVHEHARPPETHEVYSRLESIVRELRSGVSLRHWDVIEGAVFRLERWREGISRRTHEQTADADALKQARADAEPERRAQIEQEEAERVAQEHRDRIAGGAIRSRDRYGSPQVDNIVREEAAAEKHIREVPEHTPATDPFDRPARQLPANEPQPRAQPDPFRPTRQLPEDEY